MHDLAVSFDAGQTLIDLDDAMLARALAGLGAPINASAVDGALAVAWLTYDRLVAEGAQHPWHRLMTALLRELDIAEDRRAGLVAQLWEQQLRANFWRRPVAGMIELVGELRTAGVRVGVLSNSEGRLAELFDEIGWRGRFDTIVDSGVVGIEKPDPRIFAIAAQQLGCPLNALIHVGDSRTADVDGAVAAGARAIGFGRGVVDPAPRVAYARDAEAVRVALRAWGVGI
ncbi:MAG: HAD family hydrolase [Deltaproteobacteria bacterium]|nr:HAD family hydrolase [Deltaproteobacteria bacterium]